MSQQIKTAAEAAWNALTDKGETLNRASFEIGFGLGAKWMPEVGEDVEDGLHSIIVSFITGNCVCDVGYISRRKADPFCHYHAGDVKEAIRQIIALQARNRTILEDQLKALQSRNAELEGELERKEAEIRKDTPALLEWFTSKIQGWMERGKGKLFPERVSDEELYDLFRKETGRA